MDYSIKNQSLSAFFKLKGAELCSLKDNKGTEYIWQADPAHWGRHAPVLFPIVGKLKDNTYYVDDKEYQLNQHGFARDLEFEMVEKTASSISFKLQSNEATLAIYPFSFVLIITYTLNENQLEVNYQVSNPVAETLYFSIGAHPAFNCPIHDNKQRSDYFLKFDNSVNSEIHLIDGGLQNGATIPLLENQDRLNISDDLFDQDALILKGFPENSIHLTDDTLTPYLTVAFEGFPYLGIWSKSSTSPFVCIEPWYGIADHQNSSQNLKEKEGIMSLKEGEEFKASYQIIIEQL